MDIQVVLKLNISFILPFKLEQLNFSHAISLSKPFSFIPNFFFVKIPKKEHICKSGKSITSR